MADELQGLKDALSFTLSVVASEHFISAGMSSPWSVAKFAKTPEDAAQVWKLFNEAVIAGLVVSALTGFLLRSWEAALWGIGGTVAVAAFVGSEYKRALEGTL